MPSRTYSGVSLQNYLETDNTTIVQVEGTASVVISPTSPLILTVNASGNGITNPPTNYIVAAFGNVTIHGELDFDQVPAIPDNALITSIRFQLRASINGIALGSYDAASIGWCAVNCRVSWEVNGVELTDLVIEVLEDSGFVAGPTSLNESGAQSVTFSTDQIINLGAGITKAQLITDYTDHDWIVYLGDGALPNLSADNGGGGVASGSFSTIVSFDNFQVTVNYTEGPEVTLSPAGGEVEPGQSITVTGPGAARFTYAATNGNQVIPIIPKIIGPEEVILEVPTPISECEDCFDDCPECEDCFTPCNEDLLGEACQACLENCLDCLVECMDDQEEGEECFQSADDPPDTDIPITIICDDPGNQFTGTVPLGTFTIVAVAASGIYQLVDGKLTDTLYSSARDGTSYEVKIPNPNGKSGFFRS